MAKRTKSRRVNKSPQGARARQRAADQSPLTAYGLTGSRWAGRTRLAGEYTPELRGRQRQRTYTKMLATSSHLGPSELLFKALASKPDYRNVAAIEGDPEAEELAIRFDEILDDMDVPLSTVAAESITGHSRGFWIGEVLLKMRRGPDSTSELTRSKYNDGLWGVQRIESRSQDSIDEWDMGPNQRAAFGFWQDVPGIPGRPYVPMWKCLHLTPWNFNGSPEGNGGALAPAYRPWWMSTDLEEIEKIGAERHAAGLPVAFIPPELLSSRNVNDVATLDVIQDLVRKVRMDETAGVVFPGPKNKKGEDTGFGFQLMSSARNVAESDVIIKREHTLMLTCYLTTFLSLGQQNAGGSQSLSSDLTDLVSQVIGSCLALFVREVQSKLYPMIARLNGWNLQKLPTLTHTDIERQDAQKFAAALGTLVTAGVLPASPSVATFALGELGWDLDLDADLPMMMPTTPSVGADPTVPVQEEKVVSPEQLRSMLTLREVGTHLGVGRGAIMALMRAGKLESYRVGRSWRFDPKDVETYRQQARFSGSLTPATGAGHGAPENGSGDQGAGSP